MLERETIKRGTCNLDIEGEFEVTAENGQKIFIPYNSNWEKIVIQVSGGLDSSLLLFITSKIYMENNIETKIFPFSLELEAKAKSLSSAREIICKVRALSGGANIQEGYEAIVPFNKCVNPAKNNFFSQELITHFNGIEASFEFNGNTKNPPESVRSHFDNDEKREKHRDYRSTIYNGYRSASPLSGVDKQGVVSLHKKYGLFEKVTPLTVSCDMALATIQENEWKFPCGNCWWCNERKWGFTSNGLLDPAPPPKYLF